ncbi:MAG: hypothetical protein NTY02_05225, partial [Acidobacteria bacterium]|nr:hypothetical protein [Acidobacteriota bacterium]
LSPSPYFTALDANGAPVAGALIYTLSAGGVWPGNALPTYQDAAGTSLNANPIVCDAAGRCVIRLLPASYKFLVCDAAGVTVKTIDNVIANSSFDANVDIEGIAGHALSVNDIVYLADGSGGTTAGRWYKTDADAEATSSNAGLVGIVPAAIASGVLGSIRLQGRVEGFVGLTPGAKYFISGTAGGITATAPPFRRLVGVADLSTSLVVQPTYTEGPAAAQTIVAITDTDTLDPADGSYQVALVTVTGAKTLNLYTAVGHEGWIVVVKFISGTSITIDPNGGQTVDGAGTRLLTTPYASLTLVSDNANWYIV